MKRLLVVLVLLGAACGGESGRLNKSPTRLISSKPATSTPSPDPPAVRAPERDDDFVDGPETNPGYIPPYWIGFEPSRVYLFTSAARAGTARPERVKIINRGTEPIRLRDLRIGSAGGNNAGSVGFFSLTKLPQSEVIAPGQWDYVEVAFNGGTPYMVTANLVVQTDLPDNGVKVIPLTGKVFE